MGLRVWEAGRALAGRKGTHAERGVAIVLAELFLSNGGSSSEELSSIEACYNRGGTLLDEKTIVG